MMMPEVPMIWDGLRREFPSTAMLSTAGGAGSWPKSNAGPPTRRKPAVRMGRERRISRGRRWARRTPGGARRAALGLGAGQCPERQPLAVGRDIDLDLVAAAEVAHENPLAERILDVALDGPLQRAGPIVLVIAVLDQELYRRRGELDLVAQPPLYLAQEDGDDLRDVVLGERVEHDDIVEPVQELRIEDLVHLLLDRVLHLLEASPRIAAVEPECL